MGTGTVTGMAALITSAGSVVTAAIGWLGNYVTAITATGNELLLLFTILPVVGLGVGLLKRMISL